MVPPGTFKLVLSEPVDSFAQRTLQRRHRGKNSKHQYANFKATFKQRHTHSTILKDFMAQWVHVLVAN